MERSPHCNSNVLHAPGDCFYCDKYEDRQLLRQAQELPFTALEANGWSGNVAVKRGDSHTHMGTSFIVGDGDPVEPCRRNFKRDWRCIIGHHETGPCGLVPKWWNLVDRWRFRRNL